MLGCKKPVPRVFLLAAIMTLPGCASVLDLDNALAVVPYNIEESGRIVVEAHVNGHGPYNFVLDTAASISAVFDPLRNELALDLIPGKSVTVHGAVASAKFSLLDIDRLELGTVSWATPRIVSLPGETAAGAGIDGILGVDFMRRYAVAFSTSDRAVRLYPPNLVARRSYQGWASVPMKAEPIDASSAAVYFMEVQIDGWAITAVFDLGAGLNMINWPGARSIGITRRASREDRMFSGALDSVPIVAQLDADEVTTANVRWRNEVFAVADVEIFETLHLQNSPAAILGARLFTQRDFIIDFDRNRLLVKVAMDEVDAPVSTGSYHAIP